MTPGGPYRAGAFLAEAESDSGDHEPELTLEGPPWARVLRVVGHREAERLLTSLGVDERELGGLSSKVLHRLIQVGPIPNPLALRLKAQFTHLGGEAAIPGSAYDSEGESEVILVGQLDRFTVLAKHLAVGVPELRDVGSVIEQALARDARRAGRFVARNHEIGVGSGTRVMGIINTTPDSFSDGGLYLDRRAAVERGVAMVAEGAAMLDIGGASSRPGAAEVSVVEESSRVVPVIADLAGEVDIPISIDTSSAEVAEKAIEAGASIVNDISAMTADGRMTEVVATSGAGVILMHMRGTPQTMQSQTEYGDLVGDVWRYLASRVIAAEGAGIRPESIAIDPGIGFAKTPDQSLTILGRLGEFRSLGVPLLVGTSRKSFIGSVLDAEVDDRGDGTAATVSWCAFQGAWCVRVHEVASAVRACKMIEAILTST